MDRGVIKSFKANYTRLVYDRVVEAIDTHGITAVDFWKTFNIRDCIEVIDAEWKGVSQPTLNCGWRSLWPEVVNNFQGFDSVDRVINQIIDAARRIGGDGFVDMTEQDVHELLDSHDEVPSDEDLIAISEEMLAEPHRDDADADADEDDGNEGQPPPGFTSKDIRQMLQQSDALINDVVQKDPLLDCALKFNPLTVQGYLFTY